MVGDRREMPERREMDMIGNVFKRHWGKITVILFTAGTIWATLQSQLSSHAVDIEQLKKGNAECHDFMVAQTETNKIVTNVDRKLDKLLLRR